LLDAILEPVEAVRGYLEMSLLAKVISKNKPCPMPHLVAVQLESFFDARALYRGIRTGVLAAFDAIRAESGGQGMLLAPAWGANCSSFIPVQSSYLSEKRPPQFLPRCLKGRQVGDKGLTISNLRNTVHSPKLGAVCVPYAVQLPRRLLSTFFLWTGGGASAA
jgi:hypothetical protein